MAGSSLEAISITGTPGGSVSGIHGGGFLPLSAVNTFGSIPALSAGGGGRRAALSLGDDRPNPDIIGWHDTIRASR